VLNVKLQNSSVKLNKYKAYVWWCCLFGKLVGLRWTPGARSHCQTYRTRRVVTSILDFLNLHVIRAWICSKSWVRYWPRYKLGSLVILFWEVSQKILDFRVGIVCNLSPGLTVVSTKSGYSPNFHYHLNRDGKRQQNFTARQNHHPAFNGIDRLPTSINGKPFTARSSITSSGILTAIPYYGRLTSTMVSGFYVLTCPSQHYPYSILFLTLENSRSFMVSWSVFPHISKQCP
jgi:hypothetical protein